MLFLEGNEEDSISAIKKLSVSEIIRDEQSHPQVRDLLFWEYYDTSGILFQTTRVLNCLLKISFAIFCPISLFSINSISDR